MENFRQLLIKILKNKKTYIIGGVFILIILLNLTFTLIIKHYLNSYLGNDIKNYKGHVEDVDLALWRGAYQIEELKFNKYALNKSIPFIEIKEIDISISWRALFRGKFLVDLILYEPRINFIDRKQKGKKQFGEDENWKDILNNLVPFNLEGVKIIRGEIHFYNYEAAVPIDIFLKNIEAKAQNIHNSKKQNSALFSGFEISAIAQNHANIYSMGTFNILVYPPAFDINFKLEKLQLTQLNSFLKYYGPLDLTSGEFDFYMELAGRNGKIKGYLKPMFVNMVVRDGVREHDDSFKEFVYEILTAVVNVILKNRYSKSLSAKIPVDGDLNNPKLDILKGAKSAIYNGFGKPEIKPQIDNEIDLKSVK